MDYSIIEEFNRFWTLFCVDETLFPKRRACTLKMWTDMPKERRNAIIEYLQQNGAPKGKNPYFWIQEFGQERIETLSFDEYYRRFGTTIPQNGWHMENPTGNKVIYVKQIN